MSEFIYLKVPKEKLNEDIEPSSLCFDHIDCPPGYGYPGESCNKCQDNLGKYQITDPLALIRGIVEGWEDCQSPDYAFWGFHEAIKKAVEG